MKKILTTAFLFLMFLKCAQAATNNALTDEQLLKIKFDQKMDSQVSSNLVFRDEAGKQIQIGSLFQKRPVVLMMGYYSCPMLCTLVLNGAIKTFQDMKWSVGEQFDVIFVSIDPDETPKLASEKLKAYLRSYGRGKASGWHFLTGSKDSIAKLTDEVGFHYAYDPAFKQYAHPSGLVILTPDRKVERYLFGVTYSAKELNSALHDASTEKHGSVVEQFILLCCQYNPLRGKYGNLVMDGVRVGGVVMVLALGAIIFIPRKPRKPGMPK
jgi:protein SCO1/2